MKVALMLHGHFHHWEKCKDSFIQTFAKYNPDVFVHTYYDSYYKGNTVQYTEEDIKKMLDGFNICGFDIESTADREDSLRAESEKWYLVGPTTSKETWLHVYAQMYKMKQVNDMRKKYMQQTGVTYDLVIRARPAIIYTDKFPDVTLLTEMNGIGMSNTHLSCDRISVGKPNFINRYCACFDNVPRMYEHCKYTAYMTMHTILHYTLAWANIRQVMSIPVLKV